MESKKFKSVLEETERAATEVFEIGDRDFEVAHIKEDDLRAGALQLIAEGGLTASQCQRLAASAMASQDADFARVCA